MAASSPKAKVKKQRSILSFMPKSGESVSPPDKSEKKKKQISVDATPDETDSSSTIKVCRPNTIEGPERKKPKVVPQKFQHDWLRDYSWLRYDNEADAL